MPNTPMTFSSNDTVGLNKLTIALTALTSHLPIGSAQ